MGTGSGPLLRVIIVSSLGDEIVFKKYNVLQLGAGRGGEGGGFT